MEMKIYGNEIKYTQYSCNSSTQKQIIYRDIMRQKPLIKVGYMYYAKNFKQPVCNWWFQYCYL
jgi:hypothetical protein